MKTYVLIVLFSLSTAVFSQDNTDIDPLANFQVSKDDIYKSLDALKAQGKISESDYQKAKQELTGMSSAQVSGLKETAIGIVRNNPEKAEALVKGSAIDLKEVEKEAQKLSNP